MTDQEDNIYLGEIAYVEINQWTSIQISDCLFAATFCPSVDCLFGDIIYQNVVKIEPTVLDFLVVQRDKFCPHHEQEEVNFYKQSRLCIIGLSVTTYLRYNNNLLTIGPKMDPFTKKLPKVFFLSTLSYTILCYAQILSLFKA